MGLRPLTNFCGVASLATGVTWISKLAMIISVLVLCVINSKTPLKAGPINWSAREQVILGAWALVGIPIAITGGIAALYRMPMPLRAFFYYLVVSFVIGLCTMTLPFLLFLAVPYLLCMYVVWSSCEEVEACSFPELVLNSDVLKNAYSPDVVQGESNEDTPLWDARKLEGGVVGPPSVPIIPVAPPTRLAWMQDDDWRRGVAQSQGMAQSQNFGSAQSFVPTPGSGFF